MPRIRNDTTQTLDFIVSGAATNGVPPTDSIAPGETKDIDVDENDATYQGRIIAGAIVAVGAKPAKPAKPSNRVSPAE